MFAYLLVFDFFMIPVDAAIMSNVKISGEGNCSGITGGEFVVFGLGIAAGFAAFIRGMKITDPKLKSFLTSRIV